MDTDEPMKQLSFTAFLSNTWYWRDIFPTSHMKRDVVVASLSVKHWNTKLIEQKHLSHTKQAHKSKCESYITVVFCAAGQKIQKTQRHWMLQIPWSWSSTVHIYLNSKAEKTNTHLAVLPQLRDTTKEVKARPGSVLHQSKRLHCVFDIAFTQEC